jgi:fructokinase
VKASEQDLRWLYPEEPLDRVVGRWLALGPALVVVTRGARGAHARGRTMTVDVPAAQVSRVVDTVGAGDAFTAALLDGLRRLGALGPAGSLHELSAEDVDQVLNRASVAAALSIARAGATPPTLAELDEAVRTSPW